MWYIRNIRSVQASLLEISCLQGFYNLTHVDPKWPLTSTKNNRRLLLYVVHIHTKYEICPSFPSWDIEFTRFTQFDPCWPKWPLTFTKNNRFLVLNVIHLHVPNMRSVQASLLEISCLQAGITTHAHTHVHIHTYCTYTHTPAWLQRLRLSSKPKISLKSGAYLPGGLQYWALYLPKWFFTRSIGEFVEPWHTFRELQINT